ncbi:hypothetical protein BGW38_006302, partial [Lunasporangiospora selenospora]
MRRFLHHAEFKLSKLPLTLLRFAQAAYAGFRFNLQPQYKRSLVADSRVQIETVGLVNSLKSL